MECYLPNSEKLKLGIINPISLDADLEELKSYIKDDQGLSNATKVERLKRKIDGGSWVDSLSVKVTFETKELPNYVYIAHSRYQVKPFISMPRQCFKCQGIGHIAKSCKAKQRCLLCGENHAKEICLKNVDEHKCANCKGGHKANSMECTIYRTAYQIEKVRAQCKTSYVEAKKIVTDGNRVGSSSYSNARGRENNAYPTATSYRDALTKHTKDSFPQKRSQIETISNPQTMERESCMNDHNQEKSSEVVNAHSNKFSEDSFLEKLKFLLTDILQVILKKDELKYENLIDQAVEKYFKNSKSKNATIEPRNELLITDANDDGVLSVNEDLPEDISGNDGNNNNSGKRKFTEAPSSGKKTNKKKKKKTKLTHKSNGSFIL